MFWCTIRQRRVFRPDTTLSTDCLNYNSACIVSLTQLISLPKAHLCRICEKAVALRRRVVLYIRPIAVCLRHTTNTRCQLLSSVCLYLRNCHVRGFGGCLDEVVKGPLPPFEGGIVHGYLTIWSEDIPGFDLDRDDEVVEEGEGEVEPVERAVSFFCVKMGCDRICGTGLRPRRCSVKLRNG